MNAMVDEVHAPRVAHRLVHHTNSCIACILLRLFRYIPPLFYTVYMCFYFSSTKYIGIVNDFRVPPPQLLNYKLLIPRCSSSSRNSNTPCKGEGLLVELKTTFNLSTNLVY